MLPVTHQQRYQELRQVVMDLQQLIGRDPSNVAAIQNGCQRLQQLFQTMHPLTAAEIDPVINSRWQSLQTEIHKQIQLLVTNATFLQMARQKDKIEQQKQQIGDRLHTLIGYCNLLLGDQV